MYVHAFLPNTSCNCAIVQLKSITTLLKQDTVTDCFMVSVSGPYMSSSRIHCNICDTRNKKTLWRQTLVKNKWCQSRAILQISNECFLPAALPWQAQGQLLVWDRAASELSLFVIRQLKQVSTVTNRKFRITTTNEECVMNRRTL